MKAIRIRNFHRVFNAIVGKTIVEDLERIERLQKKVQACQAVQAKAAELAPVLADQKDLEANYNSNTDVMNALKDSLYKNKVLPQSVVEAALNRFTIIDDHWRGKLWEMSLNYQGDGSVASGASGSTIRTLTEFVAHMNLEGEAGVEQRCVMPTHFTANGTDDAVSRLGMDSVYQPPAAEPNNHVHVQRATMPSPLEEDASAAAASAAAMNDAMSQLQMSVPTGGGDMSVTSNTMTIKTIDSITGESSVKAPAASGPVKAPSLPSVEDGKLLNWISLLSIS